MPQDVVAAQPHLPIVQGSSQTTVTLIHATSFLSRLLYEFHDIVSVVRCHVQVTHEGQTQDAC